jgi:hypothetical protein
MVLPIPAALFDWTGFAFCGEAWLLVCWQLHGM